jgi:hypothetical protein
MRTVLIVLHTGQMNSGEDRCFAVISPRDGELLPHATVVAVMVRVRQNVSQIVEQLPDGLTDGQQANFDTAVKFSQYFLDNEKDQFMTLIGEILHPNDVVEDYAT